MLRDIAETSGFRLLRLSIIVFVILGIPLLIYGYYGQNQVLIATVYSLVPVGAGLIVLYEIAKDRGISKKTMGFSENLTHIAELIKRDPDKGIDTLDSFLYESVDWEAFPISPSFLATYRILEQLKIYLINPIYKSKGVVRKRSRGISANLVLAGHLEAISWALGLSDDQLVFKAVRNLTFFVIEASGVKKTQSNFDSVVAELVEDFRGISVLLRVNQLPNNFWKAQDKFTSSLEILRQNLNKDSENCKWLLLMSYWLLIHFKEFEHRREPRHWFWLGRSKLLSVFIDHLVEAFEQGNFRDFVEIISESFDGRFRIPRKLYETGASG